MGIDEGHRLDAHAKPPPEIREIYKRYQRAKAEDVLRELDLITFTDVNSLDSKARVRPALKDLPNEIEPVIRTFLDSHISGQIPAVPTSPVSMLEVQDMPGLYIYPGLFDVRLQRRLIDLLLHRDLSNAVHQTNVHMHYDVSYPHANNSGHRISSFFDKSMKDTSHSPRDPAVHRPITQEQLLNKKLRWMTLGGQYDWTNKVYPSGSPPDFPIDVKHLIEGCFPMKAEAAIVNLYSPGDTLSVHRDVSEHCDRPLVSISIGCDAIFTMGIEHAGAVRTATMRIRSGDAILMSGECRYAWHGVPRILPDTCPQELRDWPCDADSTVSNDFECWRGWMSTKRINLNVRQMFA